MNVRNFLHFVDCQIYSQGLDLLKLSLYPFEELAWNALQACKEPSAIFHLLEDAVGEDKALQRFLFALEAIGGSVRGKYCVEEARKQLDGAKLPRPLEFGIQPRPFRFFHWLVKVARKLPDKAGRKMRKHFSKHTLIQSNPRRFETIPQLLIVLYQACIITENDSRALEKELVRCKKYYKEGAEEIERLDKCLSYLTTFHKNEPKDPFSEADEKSNATSLDGSTTQADSESDGGKVDEGREKRASSGRRGYGATRDTPKDLSYGALDNVDGVPSDSTLTPSDSITTSKTSRKRIRRGSSKWFVGLKLVQEGRTDDELDTPLLEGASPSQYMATNVTAHVTLDRNHMPPPPPPAIQTRPHAVTGPAAATEVQTEPLLANEPADREATSSVSTFDTSDPETRIRNAGDDTQWFWKLLRYGFCILILLGFVTLPAVTPCYLYVWGPLRDLTVPSDAHQLEGNAVVLAQMNSFFVNNFRVEELVLSHDSSHQIDLHLVQRDCNRLPTITTMYERNGSQFENVTLTYMLAGSKIELSVCANTTETGSNRIAFYIVAKVDNFFRFDPDEASDNGEISSYFIRVGKGMEECTNITKDIDTSDFYFLKFVVPEEPLTLRYELRMEVLSINSTALSSSYFGTLQESGDRVSAALSTFRDNFCLVGNVNINGLRRRNEYVRTKVVLSPDYSKALGVTIPVVIVWTTVLFVVVMLCCWRCCFYKYRRVCINSC